MIELLNHIGRLWWAWTASMFWQVGLLILLIGCVDLLTRKWAWPQLRYVLWSLILVKLLLPPSWSLPSSIVPELRPRVARVMQWLNPDRPAGDEKPAAIADFGLRIADSALIVEPQSREFATSTGGIVKLVGSVPARALGERVEGVPPSKRGQDARDTTPRGVTTNALDDVTLAAPAANPQSTIRNPQFAWQFYAMLTWLLGTSILGIWLFLRLHSVAGREGYRAAAASLPQSFYNHLADCATRLGLRRIPRVVVTKRLTSPAVFGVFAPVLLVPRGYLSKLSRRDTEHMLLHELAHIKRGDLVMHGLYMLLQIVYWYNPLLWLVRRHMHHLRELSCDGTVAELLRERTLAYRQTLLETARRMLTTSVEPGLGLLGLFEDSNYLLVRLNWLTKPTWRYSTMKRAVVATIAILMFACVLPMAQGQESASPEITKVSATEAVPARVEEDNQQAQDQVSRDIAKLQAQLEQMMAQQQELQKQLKALAEQRNQLRAERKEPVARREPAQPRSPRKRAPDDVMAPTAVPNANENQNLTTEAKEELKRAQAEAKVAQDEAKRAMKEAALAQRDAEHAQAESSHMPAWDVNRQDWAKSMQAYGDRMKQWEQSDQMKQWREDMARWGQKMGSWGQEVASRQTGAAAQDGEQPQMPPMPPMPPMPAMPPMPPAPAAQNLDMNVQVDVHSVPHAPSGNAPRVAVPGAPVPSGVPERKDGREEAVSRLEQTIDLPAGTVLEVTNEVGSINVRGTDEPGGRVVAVVKAKADTMDKAKQIAGQVKLVVTPADGKVLVSTTKPEVENQGKGPGYEVALEVTVPREVQIRVSQAVGSIRLTNLRGSVEASAKVGSIQATNVSGRVALSADVGSIEVVAPKDLSAKVQAKANIGSIQSDLPLEVAKPRGVATGSSASGTIGGGEGELSLKTNVGSIRIGVQGAEPKRAERSRAEPKPRPQPRPQSGPEGNF
jgi:beta-lactamase regulating signal transducer with metallopeptidase domain